MDARLLHDHASEVLYGQDKAQAYGPWLLFRQMGMDHVKFIPGSYDELTGAIWLQPTVIVYWR